MHIKTLQVGPIGTNCYLLCDEAEKRCAVIDPGGDALRVQEAAKGMEVPYILLTHGHYDHTGGVAALAEVWPGAKIYIHGKDFPGAEPSIFPLFRQLADKSRVCLYGEGDTLALGGLTISVLHTPGHSEGSVCLLCKDALFSGDTLFAGSCGRTDLPGGSMRQILASLKRLGQLPGDLQVYPGHMEPSTLDRERRTNYYLLQAMETV